MLGAGCGQANEHMEAHAVQYTFSVSTTVVYTICKDGAILKFCFGSQGALERVSIDAGLQSKVTPGCLVA